MKFKLMMLSDGSRLSILASSATVCVKQMKNTLQQFGEVSLENIVMLLQAFGE
ncbi:hypothetical protein [Shewanella glacialimarina]|uniref:hypothetical protein n=1 Tax=Shewanella glacialimarina TaxID=2590884 RepID=UPI001CF8FDDB|nr:hypothetical protein [Shewanella glacialimarina]